MFHLLESKNYRSNKTIQLSFVRFIFSLGTAAVGTIWALYISSFGLSDSAIGFIAAAITLLSFLFSLYSVPILEFFGVKKILILSFILYFVSYFTIAVFNSLAILLGISVLVSIATVLRVESFSILFRDNAKKSLNRAEGMLSAFANASWFLGPILAGFILATYNFSILFYVASFFSLCSLVMFLIVDTTKKKIFTFLDKNILKNFKEFITNKELLFSYSIPLVLGAKESLLYIFFPIFLIRQGISNEAIGIILGSLVLSQVIFDYLIGRISEKKGFRNLLILGFLGNAAFLLSLFWIEDIYVIIGIVIISSMFSVFIEPLSDSFFFSRVKSNEEEKFFPLFSTSGMLGGILGKLSIATVLLFLPEKFAYLIIGFFMLVVGLFCFRLKK